MTNYHSKNSIFLYFLSTFIFLQFEAINSSDGISHGSFNTSERLSSNEKVTGPDHRTTPSSEQNQSKTDSRPKFVYKDANDVCPHFENRNVVCNEHLPEGKRCICRNVDAHDVAKEKDVCDPSKFQVEALQLQDYILTIGIGYPVPELLIHDTDVLFTEDIELFTYIRRESVVIFHKRCNAGRNTFEFQFGLLKEASGNGTYRYNQNKLRTISPEIFMQNPKFIHSNVLAIEYVETAHPEPLPKSSKLTANRIEDSGEYLPNWSKTNWNSIFLVPLLAGVVLGIVVVRWFVKRRSRYLRISKDSSHESHI